MLIRVIMTRAAITQLRPTTINTSQQGQQIVTHNAVVVGVAAPIAPRVAARQCASDCHRGQLARSIKGDDNSVCS
ncbi:hypothetical protein [Pseudohongiella spirulinae]|uniref:hypothetical protein n=1 Tax=Pseudohongiella spirulinae TaxID=1249552 RepID=UPI003AAB4349